MRKNIKLTLVWPPQAVVTESLFRHYNGLGETAGYLKQTSRLINEYGIEISIHDCAVKVYTAMNMANIVYENDVIAICVNMNNINDAISSAKFFKSIDKEKKIIAYGEGICSNSKYFAKYDEFDYVIENGQYELGLEIALTEIYDFNKEYMNNILNNSNSYNVDGKLINISRDILLPEDQWGIPALDLLPIDNYISVGEGELHITACKGCPYNCEFCNEKYVSTKGLRYRPIKDIVDYLVNNNYRFKSAYLDSSTFTYDKAWVKELCNELIKHGEKVLPWKSCTRLDCIDEETIELMAKANCKRISIGVESINVNIQKRNQKVIELDKLKNFAQACKKNGIKPRALLIIGLEGQTEQEIKDMQVLFEEIEIDARYRILQNFDFLVKDEEITESKIAQLNRWIVDNPIDNLNCNFVRQLEFPCSKKSNFA